MTTDISGPVNIFWFRRDLRLHDNTALAEAARSGRKVLPVFIFDDGILAGLPADDARVSFIYDNLQEIDRELKDTGSGLAVFRGRVEDVWRELVANLDVREVYANEDYEPYALERDRIVEQILTEKGAALRLFKDQVIFRGDGILKDDGRPYIVYTPYSKGWRRDLLLNEDNLAERTTDLSVFEKTEHSFPSREELGLAESRIRVGPVRWENLPGYAEKRDNMALDAGTDLGPHLRFGTVSVREAVKRAAAESDTLLGELIWREFFMQILFHFPRSADSNFRREYDAVEWRNNTEDLERWKQGMTGFPLVDAGMRELNATGRMHNRVRMLTASFLSKHLLIDWRLGERYFAEKLLDFELASNVGNWQWAAGTGCDAQPWFRIFNPVTQHKKFDPDSVYVKRWVPEYGAFNYPPPMVDHAAARERVLAVFRNALKRQGNL